MSHSTAQTPDFNRRVMREQLRREMSATSPPVGSADTSDAVIKLEALLAEDWAFQVSDNPEFASQSGIHEYDHLLQDLSPAAFDRRLQHNLRIVGLAEQIEVDALGAEAALHLKLFLDNVKAEIRAFELGCHLYPINSIGYGGVHNNFIEALEWLPDNSHEQLLARFEALPKQVDEYIELLSYGITHGRVASQSMVRNVPSQITEAIESTAVTDMLNKLPSEMSSRAAQALGGYRQCLSKLRQYVAEEYTPHGYAHC